MYRKQINFLSLICRQKAEFLVKISTKFLDMVTKGQNRKDHSVSAIFLIYSIFSNGNQIGLFSSKVYDMLITMTGKSWGAHARWWAIAINQLTELNIKANPPCFQYACARGRAKWRHKLCAEKIRSANARNHLKYKRHFNLICSS